MRRRIRRFVIWGVLFVLAMCTGALIFAYTYVTDSRTLVTLIRTLAPKYFPGSMLRVEHVQLRPLLGQVEITRSGLFQKIDDEAFATASLPWIQIRCDQQALWRGKFDPREIIVAHPVLRLTRRSDGSWNLQGLLADPWPHSPDMRPVVRISKGTVELCAEAGTSMILHDVELTLEPDSDGQFSFEGSAQGDELSHLLLAGRLDIESGLVQLQRCDFSGVKLSDDLRDRIPSEYRDVWNELGITSGELDLTVENLNLGRGIETTQGLKLQFALRGGAWTCPHLPFPLRDVAASASLVDGKLFVSHAEGRYGKTDVTVHSARIDLREPDPFSGAFSVDLTAREVELDGRLREQLPDDARAAWDTFTLEGQEALGRINISARVDRPTANAPVEQRVTIDLLDVAVCFEGFPLPLEHLRGRMTLRSDTLFIDSIETLVGPEPLRIKGRIEHLTQDPTVVLDIEAGSLPIDEGGPLVRALPASVASLVKQFHPSGTVRGSAHVVRTPATNPTISEPWGDVRVDAILDLNEGCSMRWEGLPYPVRRLSGRLNLHPTGCTFSEVRGENGIARIAASGRVDAIGKDKFAAEVNLQAEKLRFDQQLHEALPREWRATWNVLNPIGTCRLDAHVLAGWPDRADKTHLTIAVGSDDEAQVTLMIKPAPGTPGIVEGQKIELPSMRGVTGRFEYDNGLVLMDRVRFDFRGAPVSFVDGRMTLQETGQFDLQISKLAFSTLRLDAELRKIMPPLMATFAQKLDENKPLRGQGDLTISWSGDRNQPAVCTWEHVKLFLIDLRILAGNMVVEHIQGELNEVSGRADGQSLLLRGQLEADSLVIGGLQVSLLRTPLKVEAGKATLDDIQARFLDGDLKARVAFTLTNTPEYEGSATLTGANLKRLAESLPGRQELTGLLTSQVEFAGAGVDPRQISGSGTAQLTEADLGKLPWFLRLISDLKLSRGNGAAFDSGQVTFMIKDGALELNPIKITGNTLTLAGWGTIDTQGEIAFEFTPQAGRDGKFRIPGVSELTREASGQMFRITAQGPVGSPEVKLTPLPVVNRGVTDIWSKLSQNVGGNRGRKSAPKR